MAAVDPIKVYDARWEVHEFDDSAVRRLFAATFAYGRQLGVDTVTLTRDGRLGAGHVQELALEEAMRSGLRVFLCADPISTPHGYFTTLYVSQEYPATMGLTITASHNPKEYVGVKFTVPVVRAIGLDCGPAGGLTKIRELYHSGERFAAVAGGRLEVINLTREYVTLSMRQAGVAPGELAGVSVVLDTMNGAAGPELLAALSSAGAEVEALRLVPDGNFPAGSPNPTSRGKMDEAVRLTGDRGFMVTIGVDGDGDRLVFGDRRGILSAGFAAIPILRACGLEGWRADRLAVLRDPKVNPLALAEWSKLNVRPVLFRNGHSQIKEYMGQVGAVAGVEESGHYYHRVTMGKPMAVCENSVLTALLFLRAVRKEPGVLDELWSRQREVHTTGEFNYQFESDEVRDRAMAAAVGQFVDGGAAAVRTTPDGVDLEGTALSRGIETTVDVDTALDPGWYSGFLRISTNEKGVVRSYFSAGRREEMERVEAAARAILGDKFRGRVID